MTPTASLTPAFTLDAPTATLSNSPPEPPLTLVYLESFVGESDPFAQLSGGLGAPIFVGSGYSLYLYPDAPSTQITSGSYADHAVQVSVQASTNARLSLRSSVSGAYRVTLTTDGRLVVSRDAVPLAETVLAPVASSWRLLRASVVGGVVGVSVDGREVVAVTDPDPLPAGTVMLTLPEGGLVDDLAIYVPGADALDSMQAAALGTGTPPRSPEGYFRTDAAIRQLLFNPDGSDAIFRGALRWNIHGFGFIGRGITNQNVVFSNLGYTRISPDGNFMLAHCRTLATHYNDICVQNFITGAIFPLTHDADADRHPVWFAGANGMEIVYASFPNTLGAFPEIRRIPFSSAAPATLPVPIRVAERCIDPVSVQVGTTPHLFCTRYQIAGWQGVRLLAPVFDATAQTNALTLDGDSLNLGVQLIDAAWTGTSLRLALTRYNSFGSDAALVGANSIIGLPALTTLRQIGEPNSALTYRALALSPNGRWFAFAFDSEYVGEGCGVCFNIFQSFVEDVDDPAHTRHSLSYNTFKTAPFFQWWRQTPSPELRLTLTLADGIDPAALVVGDSVTVIAQITNTGSAATTNPITLTLHVPDGIAAERAGANAVFLDILQFILALLVGESDSAPLGENALGFSRTTTGVTLTYPFTVGALAPGESEVFAFTLDVTAPQVGDFLIEGTASTTFEPTSPVTATGVDAAAAVVSSEAEARLPVAVYQVIEPAAGQCASQVDGLSVRAAASTTAELLLSAYRGVLYLDGIYRAPPDTWYRVAGYLNGASVTEFSSPGFGWVFGGPNAGYQGADPCNLPGNGVLANLILVDAFGIPIPTPTPLPTLSVTATPVITPTPYMTPTLGPTPNPPTFQLCPERDLWLKNLCLQGWNYLTTDQRNALEGAVNAGFVTNDFISLDTWWLRNVHRGITDVPPQVWQADSLNQCAGNASCAGIVRDSIFLFENMRRIGVDWDNGGGGQTLNGNILEQRPQDLWFLPETDFDPAFLNRYWGWRQGAGGFACETLRSPFVPLPGFDALADACWVCQDVPTLLYERRGFSLRDIMPAHVTNFYNQAYYRNVPAVVDFATAYVPTALRSGGNPRYRIGEMVFTSFLPIATDSFGSFNHVSIVVRGASVNMTFEWALDYVLVAQVSYSSQGYFSSSFEPGSLNLSPPTSGGRYEIITLRTYLIKHLLGAVDYESAAPPNVMNVSELLNGANLYMRHWAPPEIQPIQ